MRINVLGKEMKLNKSEVKMCREQIAHLTAQVLKASEAHDNYTYYYTFLIMMNIISGTLLEEFDPERLQLIMNVLNSAEE